MLKSKTVTSKLFPILPGLPEDVVEECKKSADDGAFLFEPPSNFSDDAKYHCLKCGGHGTIRKDLPICPQCGNKNARAFLQGHHGEANDKLFRFIHMVEDVLVIRDFHCSVIETEMDGITIKQHEHTRVFVKDGDILAFQSERKYVGAAMEYVWKKTDKPNDWRNLSVRLLIRGDAQNHPVMKRLSDKLIQQIGEFYESLKISVVGVSEQEIQTLPEIEFPAPDYSVIEDPGSWIALSMDTPVEGTDHFVKQHSWCTCCGKYFEKVQENVPYRRLNNDSCLRCGSSRYSRNEMKHFYLIDAAQLPDESVVFEIICVNKKRGFTGQNEIGVDPCIVTTYENVFINYVHITLNGEICFYDEGKQSIEKLQVPVWKRNYYKKYYYTPKAKNIISVSRAVSRTGFHEFFMEEQDTSPKYFEYLKQIPCLELFAKFGFKQLVEDIVQKDVSELPAYFRKSMKESRLGRLTKPQIKSMKESVVTLKHLIAYMQVLNKDKDALYGEFYDLANRAHERHVLDILRVGVPGLTVSKISEYIGNVDDFQCCPPNESMQLWADYLRMLRDGECDLTDQKLVYTNSLKREHDKMSRKVTQIKDAKLSEDFETRAIDNEWLEYTGDRLSTIVPKHLTELYEEGRRLSHCVGSYAKRIVDGETVIAFLRKNDSLDHPYCTVEVRNKKIVQARGFSNRQGKLIPGVAEFLVDWAKEKGLIVDVA